MSARTDYEALARFACTRGTNRDSAELQASWALDEIDKLRAEVEQLKADDGVAT